jgi:hypothetical protein
VIRVSDGVSNGTGVAEDLVVVASLLGLVTKEVDVLVGDTTWLLGLGIEMSQAVSLVPAGGENIKGDFTTNREAMERSVSNRNGERGV